MQTPSNQDRDEQRTRGRLRLPGRDVLAADLAAGLTVGAMLVPQAMAYALLAGLPPEVGLYASTVPLVLYALLGTSRQLAVGPVAIVSLLTASALAPLAEEGTAGYLAGAATLALLVGAVHLVMGALRLGFLVRLLSHPVLVGFTSAAALIIGTSQVKHLLGVRIPRSEAFHETVWELARALADVHGATLAVGLGSLAVLVGTKRFLPRTPAALVTVLAAVAASSLLDLEARGVAVVGDIPQGLPALSVPDGWGLVGDLLPAALVITLVGFLESIAVAKVYARRNRYGLVPDRELLGLGLANVGSGLVGGYPVTGGFSRTAVNASAGARTRGAAVVTAVVVTLVLVALTPVFGPLPQATLGAVVVVAVASLFDLAEIRHVRHLKTADFVTLVVAFVATLALGVELGIAVAAAGSLVVHVVRMMAPHTAVLGRLPGSHVFRNVERHPEARTVPGVAVIRFDVSLSYLNVEFVKRRIGRLLEGACDANGACELRAVVLDGSGMNDIDATATEALVELIDELGDMGVSVHLAALKGPVRDVLGRAGVLERFGHHVHLDADTAAVHLAMDHDVPAAPVETGPVPAAAEPITPR